MYGAIDHDYTGALLAKDSLERTVMKKIKIKEMRPNVSSHLNVGTAVNSITNRHPETPEPLDGKETQVTHLPAENSSAPETKQGGAE